jgi:predicted nucleic acid-binding protein
VTTFVDTSAIYALLDAHDSNHAAAAGWLRGPGRSERLLTHGYVLVESAALVNRRLGLEASRALFGSIVPLLQVVFVDEALHSTAVREWLSYGSRRSSLVDWVSFQLMAARELGQAFVFDEDFAAQGVRCVPGGGGAQPAAERSGPAPGKV